MVEKWKRGDVGSPTGHALSQIHANLDAVIERIAAIEARLYAAPIVVDETAYFPDADLVVGETVRTMQAANLPTSWEITEELMNTLPTTGYWIIDPKGAVAPTSAGVAGVKKHSTVDIRVRAANEFGFGDGKLDIRFT